ncbi:hypothetical protein ERJ75_001058400 [Trypanosoma vivax]|nr:hypothetical protein ERJ75_001058400 [Trypanosoma vivax]
MSNGGRGWHTSLEDNIRTSEETLQRLRAQPISLINSSPPKSGAPLLATSRFKVNQGGRAGLDHAHGKVATAVNRGTPLGECADIFKILQSQVQNCVVELDTERAVRNDSIREVKQVLTCEVGELRATVLHIKRENEYLSEVVRSLQYRVVPSHGAPASVGQTGGFASNNADGVGGGCAAPAATNAAIAALAERVEALETAARRKQKQEEDRRGWIGDTLHEMVGSAVSSEVERVRRVAREAARSCAEELVHARLLAAQSEAASVPTAVPLSMMNGTSCEAAREAERLLRMMENDVQRRLQEMNSELTIMRQKQQQRETEQQQFMGQITQSVSEVERSVLAVRREMQDGVRKNAQANEARLEAMQLSLESAVTDRVLDVCRTTFSQNSETIAAAVSARAEQDRRWLEDRIDERLREKIATVRRAHDAALEQQQMRLEDKLRGLQESTEELQQKIAQMEKLSDTWRSDSLQWKTRVREAMASSEEACTSAQEALVCAQKTQDSMREEFSRYSVQLKKLEAEHENSVTLMRQENEKLATFEARLGATRLVVDELSERQSSTLSPMSAKVDALQRSLQEACGRRLEELSSSVVVLQGLSEQLQLNASTQAKSNAKQLLDMRREYTASIQELKDCVLQQVRESVGECNGTADVLKAAVDDLSNTIQKQAQMYVRKEAFKTSVEQVDSLSSTVEEIKVKLDGLSRRAFRDENSAASGLSTSDAVVNATLTPGLQAKLEAVAETAAARSKDQLVDDVRELRQRLSIVEGNNVARRIAELQQLLETSQQQEAERIGQVIHRMREDAQSQLKRLRDEMGEEITDRCAGVQEALRGAIQRQQVQLDRMREALGPAQCVRAIEGDTALQEQLATALSDAFAARGSTTESFSQLKCRLQQAEAQLMEVSIRERGLVERAEACEAVLRSNAEQCLSIEKRLAPFCEEAEKHRGSGPDNSVQEMRAALESLRATVLQLQERRQSDNQSEQLSGYKEQQCNRESKSSSEELTGVRDMKGERTSLQTKGGKEAAVEWEGKLEERVRNVEIKIEVTAESIADVLDSLKQSIEQCVSSFVEEVSRAPPLQVLQVSPAEGLEQQRQQQRLELSIASVTGLDSVLLFLWRHQCELCAAIQTLQSGGLGTLDVLQHHEEQLRALLQLK